MNATTTKRTKRTSSMSPPPAVLAEVYYQLSVEQYYHMLDSGIIREGEKVELLEGCLVKKMTQLPPHASSLSRTNRKLTALLPDEWIIRPQLPLALPDSAPEPDLAIVYGPDGRYDAAHPAPADIGMLVEIADTSLEEDRDWKGRIYASAKIPVFWIVNIPERKLEVYTQPIGGKNPRYRHCLPLNPTGYVTVTLGTTVVGQILVADLLPNLSQA